MRRLMRSLPWIAGVALAFAGLQLGDWQMRRADEKRAVQAQIDSRAQLPAVLAQADAIPPEWQAVRAQGVWLESKARLIDNRTHRGQAGYHLVMPLRLEDGSGVVFVNRGWVAAGDRRVLPQWSTPGGVVTVEGRVRHPARETFMLAADVGGADTMVWQQIDLMRHRTLIHEAGAAVPLADWVLEQTSAQADGLVRDWPQPAAGVDRHLAYAFQWYALAALMLILTVWHGWRRFFRRHHDHPSARRFVRG